MSLDGVRTYDQWKAWQRQIMAKKTKPKKRKGGRSWGIPAAIAIAPGAGTGGASGGAAGGGK